MKKIFSSKQVSGVLAASMILTMLAPAMPVHAANRNISFDLGIYHTYHGTTLQSLSGWNGTAVTGVYPASANHPADTLANGQDPSSLGTNNLEMPWWDANWTGYVPNPTASSKPTPSWGNPQETYFFEGYAFAGWYAGRYEDDPTQQRINKLPTNFPYTDTTYYARYIPDGKEFNWKIHHKPAPGTNAPINIDDPGTNYRVMVNLQNRPKVVPGYSAVLNDSDVFVRMPNSNALAAVPVPLGGPVYADFGFTKEASTQNFYGLTVNKDFELTYKYAPDTNTKFTFTSEHRILDNLGNVADTVSMRSAFSAEEAITGIAARNDLIVPVAPETEARYNLVTSGTDAPFIEFGHVPNPGSYVSGYTGSFDASAPNRPVAAGSRMPNQNVKAVYTYAPNPNFRLNISVKYEDELGNDIGALVKQVSGETRPIGSDGRIVYANNPNTTVDIVMPNLAAEGYDTPGYAFTENGSDIGTVTNNYALNGTLQVGILNNSAKLLITYPRTPGVWEQVFFDATSGGTIHNLDPMTGSHGPEYSNGQANVLRLKRDGFGNVVISDPTALPLPKPDPGYVFTGYFAGNVTSGPSAVKVADMDSGTMQLTSGPYLLGAAHGYKLTAAFERDSNWINLTFDFAGPDGVMIPAGPVTVPIYPLDAMGAPRVISWQDMDPETASADYAGLINSVSVDNPATHVVKWYTQTGDVLAPTTNMAAMANGSVFTARAVLNTPLDLDHVIVPTGRIHPTTGVAEIQIGSPNPDPMVVYVVTDTSGNIVAHMSNAAVQAAGGSISGPGILPGQSYVVHTAAPGTPITPGSNISGLPAGSVGAAPQNASVPVAVAPVVGIDPGNPAYNQAEFSPVTPGVQYAILDDAGNPVTGWLDPTGNTLIVPGLRPDRTYSVVAKPAADTSSAPAAFAPGQNFRTTAAPANSSVSLVNPLVLVSATVNGAASDLTSVPAGSTVVINVRPTSGSDIFTRWDWILGRSAVASSSIQVLNNVISFEMPAANVVLDAVYGGTPGVNWQPASSSDAYSSVPGGVAVVNPNITVPGNYRVSVARNPLAGADVRAIQGAETDPYMGLWDIVVKIQQEVGGSWVDYPAYTGNIRAYINTGLLRSTRVHMMHNLASPSDPQRVHGAYESVISAPGYTGVFGHDFPAGIRHAFGYTENVQYTVMIVDSVTRTTVATFTATVLDSLLGRESLYEPFIRPDEIDVNGVTWTYKGLSSSPTSYVVYNAADNFLGDTTIYLFYENDRVQRDAAASALGQKIVEAGGLTPEMRSKLEKHIEYVTGILARTNPRKASTPELQAALALLQDAMDKVRMGLDPLPIPDPGQNIGGGSGGSGSGGGGGGGGGVAGGSRRTAEGGVSGYRTYTSGTHGNWNLLDSNKHRWEFNLNNGEKIRGWANVSYTHNGTTRVETYHFGENGIMDAGWFRDVNGQWYYLSEANDGFYGRLVKGWYMDAHDGRWYYLSSMDGRALLDWQSIAGKWYYFSKENNVTPTWKFDEAENKWEYLQNKTVRPLASMYANEQTPDGYRVNADGVWVE